MNHCYFTANQLYANILKQINYISTNLKVCSWV